MSHQRDRDTPLSTPSALYSPSIKKSDEYTVNEWLNLILRWFPRLRGNPLAGQTWFFTWLDRPVS